MRTSLDAEDGDVDMSTGLPEPLKAARCSPQGNGKSGDLIPMRPLLTPCSEAAAAQRR